MKIKKQGFIAIIVIVFLAGGLVGTAVGRIAFDGRDQVTISKSEYDEVKEYEKKYKKVEELRDQIDSEFYKEPDEQAIEDGLCKGLFEGLGDKYSSYMTKEEFESYETAVTGKYEGTGIIFNEDKQGRFVVQSTSEGSPAREAGIKKGDIIMKVDGKVYDDIDMAAFALRGNKGTKVTVMIKRGDDEKTFELTRDEITLQTVESKVLDGNIGYIKITDFEEQTDEDFDEALAELEKKQVKGMILDLRDNGGGLVDSSTNIADKLLGKGVITYMEDRDGRKDYYKSDEDKTRLPYVILVNENSASATEILAAAVKDIGQGKIVGTKTYGKGVVQISKKLSDGSGYKLTVLQYFSPNGNVIHEKGVKPDYEVKGEKKQLEKAKELLK